MHRQELQLEEQSRKNEVHKKSISVQEASKIQNRCKVIIHSHNNLQ